MTFKDVILQLESEVERKKQNLVIAQDPNGTWSHKPYLHILSQSLAMRALKAAEDDLDFFVGFLKEYKIDTNELTNGFEVLILKLNLPKDY